MPLWCGPAFLLTESREGAEDLVQDTLVRAGVRWSRIARGGAPEAYVRRMLDTQSVDNWRRWQRDAAGTVVGEPVGEPAAYELRREPVDVAARVDLARALALLTPKQRAVLVLRYAEDLSEAATAVSVVAARHGLQRRGL
ncbi:MAG: sigma factor-like helix-turn-helix DNA-binding protein [Tetrasphaera sp.]